MIANLMSFKTCKVCAEGVAEGDNCLAVTICGYKVVDIILVA